MRGPLLALVAAALLLLPGCYAVQYPESAPPRPDRPSDPLGARAVQPGGDLVTDAYILINLAVDVLYSVINPRIRVGGEA